MSNVTAISPAATEAPAAIPVPDRTRFLVEQLADGHTVTEIPPFGGWGRWFDVLDAEGNALGGVNRRELVDSFIAWRTAA